MWQLKRQVVGLDLGSTRIRTLMAEAEANGDIKVTGFGNVPSDGIKTGSWSILAQRLRRPKRALIRRAKCPMLHRRRFLRSWGTTDPRHSDSGAGLSQGEAGRQ